MFLRLLRLPFCLPCYISLTLLLHCLLWFSNYSRSVASYMGVFQLQRACNYSQQLQLACEFSYNIAQGVYSRGIDYYNNMAQLSTKPARAATTRMMLLAPPNMEQLHDGDALKWRLLQDLINKCINVYDYRPVSRAPLQNLQPSGQHCRSVCYSGYSWSYWQDCFLSCCWRTATGNLPLPYKGNWFENLLHFAWWERVQALPAYKTSQVEQLQILALSYLPTCSLV